MRRALLVAAAIGCGIPAGRSGTQADGDAALFSSEVQPVLRRHCAFLGCHGREGMRLVIYAPDFLRLVDPAGDVDPARPPLDETALSAWETDQNRRSLAARVDDGDPWRTTLVRVQLPPGEGGLPHGDGVVVFTRREDPDLSALARWIATVSR